MFALFLITIFASILTGLLAPTQKAQRGNLKDFTFPQVQDGDPIAYAVGRVKIAGTGLTWYGDFQTKAIKKSTGLFTSTTVGYKYYLGWQLVIAIGPDVKLRNLWFGTVQGQTNTANGFEDDTYIEENNPNFTDANDAKVPVPVWGIGIASYPGGPIITESTGTAILDVSNVKAFGGDNGGGGFQLSVEFYGGENTQTASAYLQSQVNQSFVPPYRGISHLICHGYIGNSASLQNMTVEVDRIYDILGLGSQAVIGAEGDANPANIIFELLTNNFGAASIPLPRMNNASFVSAGQTLYNEDEGCSIAFGSSPQAVSQTLKDILLQIDATLYEDPTDGQIYLKLIRADYVLADLPVIDDTNILSVQSFTTNMWSDTKNRIRVKYEDRSKYYDDRVAVGEDLANVSFQGGQVKAITIERPYIKRAEHANRKVAEQMAIYTTPLSKLTVTTQRFTTTLRPGSVINMVYPAYKIGSIAFRVTKVSMGDLTNNRLSLELVQDKFAQVQFVFSAPVNYWQKPNTSAIGISQYNAEEAPRFFNALQVSIVSIDNSRLFVQPIQPNIAQNGYNVWAKVTTEVDYVQIDYEQGYATFGVLNNNLAMELTSTVTLSSISDVDSLAVATQAQISSGLNLIQIDDEIMSYENYSLDMGTGLYTLETVQRGLLDTVPAPHSATANVVFLTADTVGTREFAGTENVDVLLGSYSVSDEQTQDQATHTTVQLMQRAKRPYPPADVEIDGVLYNPAVDNTSGCTVTFKRRSRLNSGVLFQTDADEAPEAGTTYIARVGIHGGTVDHALGSGDSGTFTFDLAGANIVQIIAVLNGLESQPVTWATTVAHAAGVSVVSGLATSTTDVLTPETLISHDGPLMTSTTSPIVAIATVSGIIATAPLGTSTTVSISATASDGDTSDSLSDGDGGSLDDGEGGSLSSDEPAPIAAPLATTTTVAISATGGEGYAGLLDGRMDVRAAYSFRWLNSAYTGPLVQLLRNGDSATMDWYPDAMTGELNMSAIITWAAAGGGTGSCYVNTWYDQSGNANHTTGSTYDPDFLLTGTPFTQNGMPILRCLDGSQKIGLPFGFASTAHTVIYAGSKTGGSYDSFISTDLSSAAYAYGIDPSGRLDWFQDGVSDEVAAGLTPGSSFHIGAWSAPQVYNAGIALQTNAYLNGVPATNNPLTQTYGGGLQTTGSLFGTTVHGDQLTGMCGEIFVFDDVLSSDDLGSITSNIGARFGVLTTGPIPADTPAVVGTPSLLNNWTNSTSTTIDVSTIEANDLVLLAITVEKGGATPVISSVVGATLGAFTQVAAVLSPDSSTQISLWTAQASSVLTGEPVTVTSSITIDDGAMVGFAVKGAKIATPFDPNVSLPAYAQNPNTMSVSTTEHPDLVLYLLGSNTNSNGADPVGFTNVGAITNGGGALWASIRVSSYSAVSPLSTISVASGTAAQGAALIVALQPAS